MCNCPAPDIELLNLHSVSKLPSCIRVGANLEVALVCVENDNFILVEAALQLDSSMIDGGLEVSVLSIHHQSHTPLHDPTKTSAETSGKEAMETAMQVQVSCDPAAHSTRQ